MPAWPAACLRRRLCGGRARWDGSTWTTVGAGANAPIHDLVQTPDGQIHVVGEFTEFDAVPTSRLGVLVAPCAASAVATGSGCVGSGGLEVLNRDRTAVARRRVPEPRHRPANVGFAVERIGATALSLPLSAPLPNSPALVGATFVQQTVSLELGAGGAVASASSSNALTATAGVW